MSIFKLPMSVCDELTKMMRQFWWGVENGKRKMAWVAWERLSLPKSRGGLGFRDMHAYNQALLAKQAWRLLTTPDSLCARLLKAKYFPNGNLVDTVFPSNSSRVWKGIEHGLALVKKGMIWRVGNGAQIRVWRDPWIPRGPPFTPILPKRNCRLNKVKDFLDVYGNWKSDLLQQFFCPADVASIMKICTSARQMEDFISWPWDKSGNFSVKTAYHFAMSSCWSQLSPCASSSAPTGDRAMWKMI
ncbi:hypothetical protein ZWY2020_004848 [Hordeum vulgare]|nr:hypothetical protein ZWY2020_004848 [Hordeum vulgare]